MPTGSSVIGKLLKAFTTVLSLGVANSLQDVLFLFALFATLTLIVSGALWAYGYGNVLSDVLWKVLALAVLFWIMQEWQMLLKAVREGFIQAGLLAGGQQISMTDFTDPGNIVDFGLSVTALVFENIKKLSFLNSAAEILLSGATAWLVIAMYCVIAGQIFMAILEFYLVGICSIFLLPFLAFEKTAFVGERVFGGVVAHGIRLMYLALILSIALPILYQFKLPADPLFQDIFLLFAASLILLMLAWNAPAVANGLVSGIAVLHAGHAISTATGAVGTATTIGAAAAGISVLGAAAIRSAVTGASALGNAAQTGAAHYQHQNLTMGWKSSVIGGAQGIGQYVRGRTTQGFRDAVNNGRVRASRHVP